MAKSTVIPPTPAVPAGSQNEKRLRVAIVTYYWPPSGGAGVQRWLKLAKCLAAGRIVEPIIFTPSNPDPPLRDESLLQDVPEGMRVIAHPIMEPSRALRRLTGKERGRMETTSAANGGRGGLAAKAMLWARGNLFIPDARLFWIRPAAKRLEKWIRDNGADALITTGPPHSMHLIGLRVKRATALPWIADFRDPWVDFPYLNYLPLTRYSRRRHAALERRVVATADRVIVVSPTMQRNFENTYHRPVDLIYNGYDSDDFSSLPPHAPSQPFTLLHSGEMKDDQNPHALWNAIAALHREGKISPRTLQVKLVGRAATGVIKEIEAAGISQYVDALPPVAHSALPPMLRQAAALLLSINRVPSARGIITGKLFEYLAAERPILAFGPPDGDTAELMRTTSSGKLFDHNDAAGVEKTLLAWMEKEAKGTLLGSNEKRENYSRQAEAEGVEKMILSVRG